MALATRPVNLVRDESELLQLLEANLSDFPHRRRLDWLYRQAPAGAAWAWFVCERNNGRAIGTVTVVPREIWVDGRTARCGQVCDFAVVREHRSLGPAVTLQRATFEPVHAGQVAFCYDCPPHDGGMAPFVRLGMKPTVYTARYAVLLRVDRHVAKRLGRSAAARGLAAVANHIIAAGGRRVATTGLEISTFEGRFGGEFTVLDQTLRSLVPIRARCRAEDLNWQYRDDPLRSYEILVARRRGELRGFIVLSGDGDDAWVVDLVADDDDAPALLEAAREHVRHRSVQVLNILVSRKLAVTALARVGFRRRDEGPRVVTYAAPSSHISALLGTPENWLVQQADVLA